MLYRAVDAPKIWLHVDHTYIKLDIAQHKLDHNTQKRVQLEWSLQCRKEEYDFKKRVQKTTLYNWSAKLHIALDGYLGEAFHVDE